MRASTWMPPALLLMAACGGGDEPLPGPLPSTDTDDTAEDDDRFEPVAVGFEFDGVVLSDGTITGFKTSAGEDRAPVVVLTLASEAYFQTSDPTAQEQESCIAWGEFAPEPRDEPLPTEGGMPVWNSYEGTLVLQYHTCADRLPEEWGVDAARIGEVFSGMRLGIAFGPMTDYLREAWSEASLEEYGDFLFAEYIAINAPDGSFVGEDWTSAVVFQWDPLTGERVLDDTGEEFIPIQTSHLPAGAALPEGYVRSFAYWYQDFPLMDFDKLKDDAPE